MRSKENKSIGFSKENSLEHALSRLFVLSGLMKYNIWKQLGSMV